LLERKVREALKQGLGRRKKRKVLSNEGRAKSSRKRASGQSGRGKKNKGMKSPSKKRNFMRKET